MQALVLGASYMWSHLKYGKISQIDNLLILESV